MNIGEKKVMQKNNGLENVRSLDTRAESAAKRDTISEKSGCYETRLVRRRIVITR